MRGTIGMRAARLAVGLAVIASGSVRADDADDARVRGLIAQLTTAAGHIEVDGRADDWQGFPRSSDDRVGPPGDPARDIVRTAIAPTADALYVLIETAARPLQASGTYWVSIDFTGTHDHEVQIGIGGGDTHRAWVFPPGGTADSVALRKVRSAVREVVELRIPYASLSESSPVLAHALARTPRPWVRVRAESWLHRARVEWGPAVASYRLVTGTYGLDAPAPAIGRAPRAIPFFLEGTWFVWQGPHGSFSHRGVWAYDFAILDQTFQSMRAPGSPRNEDGYAWGQVVAAPLPARVIRVHGSFPDEAPGANEKGATANEVSLDIGDGIALSFLHFRKRGVDVHTGQELVPGTILGRIGNSGFSAWPHVHVSARTYPLGAITMPMALARVRVGINRDPADPWARDFDWWDVREGMFVHRRLR